MTLVGKSLPDWAPASEHASQLGKLEAVGRLAGGVAHDFNNLLTVILGCGELLLRKHRDDAETRSFLEQITAAGEKASALTRQLLLFSRKQQVQPVVLNLNDVVNNLVKMLRRLIAEDIRLTMSLEPSLYPVKADAGHLEQVLMNLVINARDAMPKGGHLLIETSNVTIDSACGEEVGIEPGSYATLVVRDTGCGMDDDVMNHLFEPFFTTKAPGKGTGLGLATVYGVVKQNGGHIRVASKRSVGTRFRIYLPAAREGVAPTPGRPETIEGGKGTETILLVEDDDGVRGMAKQVLCKNGYQVLEAANGLDALSTSEHHAGPIHLVITDIIMPFMTGTQLVKELASRRAQTKFLFMSGYTESVLAPHDEEDIHSTFMEKPFTPPTLIGAVRKALAG